ncbi:MAG: hypothetical protein ACOC7R_02975 [Planctomycetota bacterium]
MSELMLGAVQPESDADKDLMKAAGIDWVRLGTPFPFVDRLGGELTKGYRRYREVVAAYAAAGIRVMGVTAQPGSFRWERQADGTMAKRWRSRLPEWFGALDTPQGVSHYEAMCRWLGEDLKASVRAWQVANELDISTFAGQLDPRQACDLLLAGARGLKDADPSLIVGHNPTGSPAGYYFYGRLYGGGERLLDYCGIDKYFGSWSPGGPDDWAGLIRELYDLTQTPVLINEWGFASAGGVMTDDDRRAGRPTCQTHRWPATWGDGHTPETQAAYIRAAFDAFIDVKDLLLGELYFRWADTPTCWQCGQSDCPAETAWGLVDRDGNPKPSYEALKEGARRLREA